MALAVVNARLARMQDGAALRVLSRQSEFLGRVVFGPAAAVTVVAGILNIVLLLSTVWAMIFEPTL